MFILFLSDSPFMQTGIRTKFHRSKWHQKEVKLKFAAEQSARSERITHEDAG